MTEKQLISQLNNLKNIQPSKDWVVFTKDKIFEQTEESRPKSILSVFITFIDEFQKGEKFVFQHKMAFASVLIVVVFSGMFGFAQNSVPGDSLFALKKMTEQGEAVFVTNNYKSIHNFEIAGKRLDDLEKIAQSNDVKNLASALTEYNKTLSKAAETIGQIEKVEDVAVEVKKIQEKENLIRSFGIEIGDNEDMDNALAVIVERELESLKQRDLTEEQELTLLEIEQIFEQGNYSEALEKILITR